MLEFLQIPSHCVSLENEKTILGISYDVWFTGLIPVLIFILGYVINRIIENNKEKKRLCDLEKYFNQLIIFLKEPLQKQVNEFLKTSASLKQKKEQHLYLNYVTGFNLEQIKEINNKDLFTIYIKNKPRKLEEKAKSYSKLRAGIDYLDVISKSMKEELAQFQESYDENELKYKQSLEELEHVYNAMILQFRLSNVQSDNFLLELAAIRKSWFEYKKEGYNYTDMYIAKEIYLEKYRELCIRNMNDPRAVASIRFIMSATYAFHNIVEAKSFFRKLFVLHAREIQRNWFVINNSLEAFKKIKR